MKNFFKSFNSTVFQYFLRFCAYLFIVILLTLMCLFATPKFGGNSMYIIWIAILLMNILYTIQAYIQFKDLCKKLKKNNKREK